MSKNAGTCETVKDLVYHKLVKCQDQNGNHHPPGDNACACRIVLRNFCAIFDWNPKQRRTIVLIFQSEYY
jgi:hypothetical protein